MTPSRHAALCGLILLVLTGVAACVRPTDAKKTELQRVTSGALDIILVSDHDALRHGTDAFFIEFKSTLGGSLVDVGNVRATGNMPMPGMAMFGDIGVQRTDVPGRYAAKSQFDMAGTWRMSVEWDGPAGHGSITFSQSVL